MTALLLIVVVAIFEDKSLCGTGGGSLFVKSLSLKVMLAFMPAFSTFFQDLNGSGVEVEALLVSRCVLVVVWGDLMGALSSEPHANSRSLSTPSKLEDIMTLGYGLGTLQGEEPEMIHFILRLLEGVWGRTIHVGLIYQTNDFI